MIRSIAFAAAAAASLLSAAAPAVAQGRGYYVAAAQNAPAGSLVTRSTVWKCADGVCSAPKSPQRDTIMCELVAREVGTLTSFAANGASFDAAALEKCNAKAK